MGVTCIFYIKELSIVTDIMSTMENRIINIFGGKRTDHWSVVCKLYKSVIFPRVPIELIKNSGRGESMYLLSFSSKPSHVYSIIDEKLVMEADNSLVELISKIKNIWTVRQIAKIDGYNFEIGDYNVRYGNLNVGSNAKGLLVEVEHTKSNSVTESSDLLIEFIDYLIPKELFKNYKLELKRPDNGYDYTTVGLSQSKEEYLSKKFNNINKSIIPNVKMEIDNTNDTLNANTINSSSNEVLNSPYSNNQSSIIETGSLGSTLISNLVNETNKYVNTVDSSITTDTLATTTNNSSSLNTSSLNTTNLQSSLSAINSTNTNINTATNTNNTNTTININSNKNNTINATNLKVNGISSILPSTTPKISTTNDTAIKTTVTTTSTTTAAAAITTTNKTTTTLPNASTTSTVAPIAPIPAVGTNPLTNPLTNIGALANLNLKLNPLALNAAANSLTATDITNYDINVGNSNTLSPLNLTPPSAGVPGAPFLFNPLTNPLTAAVTPAINPSLNLFNTKTLPTLLNASTAATGANSATATTNLTTTTATNASNTPNGGSSGGGLTNVFSKAKQNSLLSTINKKKKEPLLNTPRASSHISDFISTLPSNTNTNSLKSSSITSLKPMHFSSHQHSNINSSSSTIFSSYQPLSSPQQQQPPPPQQQQQQQQQRTSSTSPSQFQEGKEIKEVKERAHYNFTFTSRHTAFQYINLLRSEKIL